MRFGNPAPIATEGARGDFAGSGRDHEPKALSTTRRGDHPRAVGRGGRRSRPCHRFARGWPRHRATTSGCADWLVPAACPCVEAGLRTADGFPALMSSISRGGADVTPLAAGWSGAHLPPGRCDGPVRIQVRWTIFLVSGRLSNKSCRRREVSPGLASWTCPLVRGSSGF